jgi:hypothetical protein
MSFPPMFSKTQIDKAVKRVRATYPPHYTGTVIIEGPEVSGVHWDHDADEYVPNKYLMPVKTTHRERF